MAGFQDLKNRTKLYFSFVLTVIIFGGIIGYLLMQLNSLHEYKEEVQSRNKDASELFHIERSLDYVYSKAADSIIN